MKCVNCSVNVSPDFIAAIIENRCPACGQQLMDGGEYQKLMALKKQLAPLGLGLEENELTKVSAAIMSKFDIWPRSGEEEKVVKSVVQIATPQPEPEVLPESMPPRAPKPIKPKNVQEAQKIVAATIPGVNFDDDLPLSIDEEYTDIPPSNAADIIKEFGLDKGELSTVALADKGKSDPLLNAIFSDMPLEGDMPIPGSPEDRMERAKALQGTVNSFGIKPMTGRRTS